MSKNRPSDESAGQPNQARIQQLEAAVERMILSTKERPLPGPYDSLEKQRASFEARQQQTRAHVEVKTTMLETQIRLLELILKEEDPTKKGEAREHLMAVKDATDRRQGTLSEHRELLEICIRELRDQIQVLSSGN